MSEVKKPRGITDEVVDGLTTKLLSQIYSHNMLAAKMTLRHILKLPNQGSKVLRSIYKTILAGDSTLSGCLRKDPSNNISWWSGYLTRPIVLEKMTRLLMEFDSLGMVKAGKFYTLPKIGPTLLIVDPEVIEYLFKAGRVLAGKNFTIQTTLSNEPISQTMAMSIYHEAGRTKRNQSNHTSQINTKLFGIDESLILNLPKFRMNLIERVRRNLVFSVEFFGEKHEDINQNALHYLTSEFIKCHQLMPNSRYNVYTNEFNAPDFISAEDYSLFSSDLRSSIFDAITLASNAIHAHNKKDITEDIYKKHGIERYKTSMYRTDIQKEGDEFYANFNDTKESA